MEVVGTSADEDKGDSSYINEVKLRKYGQNIYGLNRNGQDMRCPIIPPSIIQRIIEPTANIALMNGADKPKVETYEQPKPCNSNCPLFHMHKTRNNGSISVDICCGSTMVHYSISESDIIPFKPQKQSKQ